MSNDDWGCVAPQDLFTRIGKTQSLQFLVEQANKILNETKSEQLSPVNGIEDMDTNSSTGSSSRANLGAGTTFGLKKILKKNNSTMERVPNLKRVTFEVENFVIEQLSAGDDRQNAEAQLAIRLGAKQQKNKAVNYKQLKETRQQAKERDSGAEGMSILRQLNNTHSAPNFKSAQKKQKQRQAKRQTKRKKKLVKGRLAKSK